MAVGAVVMGEEDEAEAIAWGPVRKANRLTTCALMDLVAAALPLGLR